MTMLFYILSNLLLLPPAFFAIKAMKLFLPPKDSRWKKVLLFTGFFLLTNMRIYIGDLDNLPPTILFFLFCVLFCCEGTLLCRLAVGVLFAGAAFSFNALTDNYIFRLSLIYHRQTILNILLLHLLYWSVLYFILRRFAPEKDYALPASYWRLTLFLSAAPVGIVLALVLLTPEEHSMLGITVPVYITLLLLSSLSIPGLFFAITVLARQTRLEQQNAFSEMNRKYYEMLERQQFEVRRLKHDMANHLQVLSALPAEEKKTYLETLVNSPVLTETAVFCKDSTVNTILATKKSQMDAASTVLHMDIGIDGVLPFEKTDLCAIFANALDNALEACLILPVAERHIFLKTRLKRGIFVLEVKNPSAVSYDESKEPMDGVFPRTTKKDAADHGYGLKSIREAVSKYGDHMEIRRENGEFILFLYIPAAVV